MRIGLAQMNSQPEKRDNLDNAVKMIGRLAAQKAALIVLP